MGEPDGQRELAAGRHVTLLRTPVDYRVVHRRAVESFPLTDEGSDDAWARYRSLAMAGRLDRAPGALVVLAITAGVCWVLLGISWAVMTAFITSRPTGAPWVETILTLSQYRGVFYALFVGSLGCYVTWWLYRIGRTGPYA